MNIKRLATIAAPLPNVDLFGSIMLTLTILEIAERLAADIAPLGAAMTITIELTREQAKELASLLWECCTETDDGMQYLREDLPLSAIWRIVAEAIAPDRDYADDAQDVA